MVSRIHYEPPLSLAAEREREGKDRRSFFFFDSLSFRRESKSLVLFLLSDNFSAFYLSLSFIFLLGLSHESTRLFVPCPRRKREERRTEEKLARLRCFRAIGCGSDPKGKKKLKALRAQCNLFRLPLPLTFSPLCLVTCPFGRVKRNSVFSPLLSLSLSLSFL